jgi:hypothetical protein
LNVFPGIKLIEWFDEIGDTGVPCYRKSLSLRETFEEFSRDLRRFL